jgi:tRNA dimethylallyltransferase
MVNATKGNLIAILGPTAVGKTAVALRLAEELNGEIISADSRQVYRMMDIGTAKPTRQEVARVPHHLVSLLPPDARLTLAEFQQMAYKAIDDVLARKRLPLLVGGTGQYVWAVLEGWQIPRVPPDPKLRAELEAYADTHGSEALHRRLADVDPQAAEGIDHRNVRRVIRALEVCIIAGRPITELRKRRPPPYHVYIVGLDRPRDELYRRIDARVDAMMEAGLLEEVERLLETGYKWNLSSMTGLGYAQLGKYLRGELSLDEAVSEVKTQTHRFVRQQYTWFQLDDPRIHWFELRRESADDVISAARAWLQSVGESSGSGELDADVSG